MSGSEVTPLFIESSIDLFWVVRVRCNKPHPPPPLADAPGSGRSAYVAADVADAADDVAAATQRAKNSYFRIRNGKILFFSVRILF